jgi:hypothetical protein
MDRNWVSTVFTTAIVELYARGEPDVAIALWRCQRRLELELIEGQLHAWLWPIDIADAMTLAIATRSATGTAMPGPLDLAFEKALPTHPWPVFHFAATDDARIA